MALLEFLAVVVQKFSVRWKCALPPTVVYDHAKVFLQRRKKMTFHWKIDLDFISQTFLSKTFHTLSFDHIISFFQIVPISLANHFFSLKSTLWKSGLLSPECDKWFWASVFCPPKKQIPQSQKGKWRKPHRIPAFRGNRWWGTLWPLCLLKVEKRQANLAE